MTQVESVYEYMKNKGGITSIEAYEKLGITQLGARISNLKDQLRKEHSNEYVSTEWKKVSTRKGTKSIVEYSIKEYGQE